MARADANTPDIRRAGLVGSFAGNGPSLPVVLAGPFNVTIANPQGGTVTLERSFDGGTTYFTCSRDTAGSPAAYTTAVSFVWPEMETGVNYRLTMAGFVAGPVAYRISQ